MRKIVLTYGLVAGAILSLSMLGSLPFMEQIGFEHGMVIGYTSMVAAFLMVYFGIRSYRDQADGGRIGFGRAFVVGLAITLVGSACYVATWQFVYHRVSPDFMEKYSAYAIDKARKAGASEARVAAQRKEMQEFAEMYKNPLVNIAFTFLEPLPVGLLFTGVSAFMLSRPRRVLGVLAG
jgi:hypothetical protein